MHDQAGSQEATTMALLAILSKAAFDLLSDAVKKEYKDLGDGTYELQVTPVEIEAGGKKRVYALEDVHGLKSALQKERTEKETLALKAKDFDGMDPREAREAMKRLKEISEDPTTDDKVKLKVDATIKQLNEKHANERKGLEDQLGVLEGENTRLLVDNALATALGKHKLVEGGAELITPHLKSQIKIVKLADGKRAARVIDPGTGQERVSLKKDSTNPMDIDELVELTSKSKVGKAVFAGSGASGSDGGGKRPASKSTKDEGGDSNGDESGRRGLDSNRAYANPAQRLMDVRERMAKGEG